MSAEARDTSNVGAGLWKGIGMWAWLLFRISGLVLLGYLFVHIWVISQGRVNGPQSLDDLFETFDTPVLVFLDFMLVVAVLYHALNGVRLVLMDFGVGLQRHKLVFWLCMAVAAAAARRLRLQGLRLHLLRGREAIMRADVIDTHRGGMWPWLGQRVTAVVVIVTIIVHLVLTHYVEHRRAVVRQHRGAAGQRGRAHQRRAAAAGRRLPRPQRAAHGRP